MNKVIKLIDQIENIDELNNIIQHTQKKLDNSRVNLALKILNSTMMKKLSKKQQKFASNIKKIERNVDLVDYHMSAETIFYIDDIKCAEYYVGTNDGDESEYSFWIGELLISRDECSSAEINFDELDDETKDNLNEIFNKYDVTTKECYDVIIKILYAVMEDEWNKK